MWSEKTPLPSGYIHPAVIKFFRELDLIIRYEKIACRFHLFAILKMRIMQKMQLLNSASSGC